MVLAPGTPAPTRRAGRRGVLASAVAVAGEVLSAGTLALRVPPGATRRRPWARHDATGHGHRWPVVLVHGFAGTDAVWDPLSEQLCAAGFGYVVRLSYNSFLTDAAEVVRAVREHVSTALERTGAAGVHLVGHSLGGLLVRSAVDCDAFAGPATVVSIATPHRGVRLARLLPGSCARLLHPAAAPVARSSPREHRSIRWVTFSSDGDWWVPPSSARLPPVHPAVTNLDVPGVGHLTICRHPGVVARVVAELLRSERRVPDAVTRRVPAEAARL